MVDIEVAQPVTTKSQQVDLLNQQARDLIFKDPGQAAQLFEQAISQARAGEFETQPYRPGLAEGMAGLARIHMESRPDLSAQYCLQVQSLLSGQPVIPPLIETKNCLGWIYLHLGDYSTAMEWALQALNHCQQVRTPAHEAASLDLIANLHAMLGDHETALRTHQSTLQMARASGNRSQEAQYLNNLAMTQMEMGSYEAALDSSLSCLRIFEELGIQLDIANCYDTLAQIYLNLGDFRQAEESLVSGLRALSSGESQVVKAYLLKSLGRVYLALGDADRAAAQLEQASGFAREHNLRGELAECQLILSTARERQGRYAQALEHYRAFHEIHEEVSGDAAKKRLAVLNVIHAVENAKHEAEIYRLRNIELQSEIDERKRIQVALEELATIDPLTSLYNRRVFMEKSVREFERAGRLRRPMGVIMLDLDHFKGINDTYGHAIGDQVLSIFGKRLKGLMRGADFAGRMGGEEFTIALPDTPLEGARQVAERICRSLSNEAFSIGGHAIHVTASIGVTCCPVNGEEQPASIDILLHEADQALYQAKGAGRNQVKVYAHPPGPLPSGKGE